MQLNKNRILFYLLASVIVNMINVLKDLRDEGIYEALFHASYTLPVTFGFTLLIYIIRSEIQKSSFYQNIVSKNKHKSSWPLWFASILLISFTFTTVAIILAHIFYPGYNGNSFFSMLFWGIFIALFCITLFVYVLEAFLESETEKEKFAIKLKEIENERTIAKYQSLKNQLNPHFLFNSFNSLSALITIDSKKAEDFLQGLSNVYRYNLDHSEEIVVTLEKEIELIQSYMTLQQIRFQDSLTVNFQIAPEQLTDLIPPMTLELLCENAIKHNVIDKKNPLDISITTMDDFVLVSNNYQRRGDSLYKTNSLGIGLKNLTNQYKLIHTETPSFQIVDGNYVAIIPLIKPSI